MKKLFIPFLAVCFPTLLFSQSDTSGTQKLIIGTYTSGKSEGVYVYNFDLNTGKAGFVSSVFSADPSYVAVSADSKFVYAVNEEGAAKGSGKVTAFSYSNGRLTTINTVASGGDDPCYITTDHTGKWLVTGNYSGGNFSVFPLNADGSVGNAATTINHAGSSLNKERQTKPHVHCTMFSPDNKYLLVADLGTDKIVSYSFNSKNGSVKNKREVSVQAGAGPRHLAFSPDGKHVYLTEEMFGNVDVYQYKKGKLKWQQTISMVPPKFMGRIGAADIHISGDGKFLYTSNRGESDMLTIFSIAGDGKLKVSGYQEAMGINPRNFVIDPSGKFLLVANQSSDEVVIFRRDKNTGLLTDTNERIKLPNPVCLKWIN